MPFFFIPRSTEPAIAEPQNSEWSLYMLQMHAKHCVLQLYAKNMDTQIISVFNYDENRKRFCTNAKWTKADKNVYSVFQP